MVSLTVIVSVLLLVILSLSVFFTMKRKKAEEPPRYVCSHCGEKHCDCHVQPED